MHVPVIDFAAYDSEKPESLSQLGGEVETALTVIGFMSITNLGIPAQMLRDLFSTSREFFASSVEHKMKSAYLSASKNFGYQGLCQKHLDPQKSADLKETFAMRNVLNHSLDDDRWPSRQFRELMHEFFGTCLVGAYKVQRVLAAELNLEPEFFVRYHSGENCTLRLLYCPDSGVDEVRESQLGAGAHTDYALADAQDR